MKANFKSIGEWLAETFGNNITKVASEGLTAEEYNSFEKTGASIQQRLAGLEVLIAEKETLTASNLQLTEQLTAQMTANEELTSQLSTVNADLGKYKALYDNDVNKGKGLPKNDASSRDDLSNQLQSKIDSLEQGHPDRVGLEAFLATQAKKKK
jgi:hypothetical protein